jgi:hypothetical protein
MHDRVRGLCPNNTLGRFYMRTADEKHGSLTETQILREFRAALVAVYPVLQRLDCLADDTQSYDDFDSVAECLWDVIVCRTLKARYGLSKPPRLTRYGFDTPIGEDGFIEVIPATRRAQAFRFVECIGDRKFGPESFNAVRGVLPDRSPVSIAFSPDIEFRWIRHEPAA